MFQYKCYVFDLSSFLKENEKVVSAKLGYSVLDTITKYMNKSIFPCCKDTMIKMKNCGDITARFSDSELLPVDHYLMDEDVFNLASKHWDKEIRDGSFFKMPELLGQWCDLTVRSCSEVKKVFDDFLLDEEILLGEEVLQYEKEAALMENVDHDEPTIFGI